MSRIIAENSGGGHVLDAATGNGTPVCETSVDVTKLPSMPFLLSFNHLTYSVKVGRKMPLLTGGGRTKTLLNGISGVARDGEILAVLGASGSGKSTLIDALANRISKGSLKGNITLNDEVVESRVLKSISAYVMQHDLLFPMLTVEETLMFAAEFRLPRTMSKSKKRTRVQALIDQLGLRNATETVIGDEGHRGVSGGERRRVSIGVNIIHDPIILFLDEPTSGLDSTSAFMIPSYRILGLLDRLIILSNGQTVYTGLPTNLSLYFSEFGYSIPKKENKTEFALDLIWELEGSPEGTKSLIEFNKKWQSKNSELVRLCSSLKEAISVSISKGKLVSTSTAMVPRFANSFWKEILIIIQERLGFYACTDTLPVLLHERYIFMRETAYNSYKRSSYVISNALVVLPGLIILSFAFTTITFWAIGLNGGFSGFLYYLLIIFASFWSGSSLVTFLSGIIPHLMLGYPIVVAILECFLLFSGFFINRDRIPAYWIWFHYLSVIKYPYEAVLHNEFDNSTECFMRGIQLFDDTPLVTIPNAMKVRLLQSFSDVLGTKITSSTCFSRGVDILRNQGITDLSKWDCLFITLAWGFFFRILFYFSLLFGSKNKRT
ncbi:hypothetical protein ES288_D13G025100v1 [Gossypium darwinii]|uniref:ABC transporter domain-containing protein n=1 Tax=Gossypium darwinii TaxID=34276 RepID=A0A5D1ZV12_GOSDA|nr:hypothetical protein ES288_D13G025100v1 [Gossypium darwinii]